MMKSTLVTIAAVFVIQLALPGFLTAETDKISGPICLADKADEKMREQEKKFEEMKRDQEKMFEEMKRDQEKKFEEKKRDQEKKFEEKQRDQEKKFEEKQRDQEKKFEEKQREHEQEREESKQEKEKSDNSGGSDSKQQPGDTRQPPGDSGESPDSGKSGCVALKDVHGNLSNHKGKTVTVCGNVTELLEIPLLKTGTYKLNDGTETLWVIPSGSVPAKGSSVRVTGKVDVEVKIAGFALGVVVREN